MSLELIERVDAAVSRSSCHIMMHWQSEFDNTCTIDSAISTSVEFFDNSRELSMKDNPI